MTLWNEEHTKYRTYLICHELSCEFGSVIMNNRNYITPQIY